MEKILIVLVIVIVASSFGFQIRSLNSKYVMKSYMKMNEIRTSAESSMVYMPSTSFLPNISDDYTFEVNGVKYVVEFPGNGSK